LEIAGIAAKALALDSPSIGTPFADTSNAYVLELYEAGIVEGSSNSTARAITILTSITGRRSAPIIWRMNKLAAD
jgi:hypothetical protein